MRIIERYPPAVRIYQGRGLMAIFLPLRAVLSWLYGVWLGFSAGRVRAAGKAPKSGDARNGSAARIISVGNIEVGGAGKTPLVIRLAGEIASRGGSPVVVTRGYGSGVGGMSPFIVTAGKETADTRFETDEGFVARVVGKENAERPHVLAGWMGDEAVLYRSRGIPVVLDPDRNRGIDAARSLFDPTHILLDDAFQNRSVAKDLDILLLDAERPFGSGRLLPLGTLRERPDASMRADAFVFTRASGEAVPESAGRYVKGKPVFFSKHEPLDLMSRSQGSVPLSRLVGERVPVFSGIARPDSLEELVLSIGASVDVAFRFVDHHRYREEDVRMMLRETGGGTRFVTTEKDWVKAAGLFPEGVEVFGIRVTMEVRGIDRLLDMLSA